MSGGGFQVVMSDLQSAAGTFHREAATFQAIMPDACTSLPDGGSAAFNESLNAVVEAITLVHMQIGGDIDGIGDSAVKTGQDFANIGKSIWHGISSIF